MTADIRKIIIIGSGPAGLTAAIYAARANLNPLVFAGGLYGGQLMLTSDVENFPGFPEAVTGPDLMERFRKQAERFGAEIRNEDVTRVDFTGTRRRVWVHEQEFEAESIVIATGASSLWLDLENETRLRGRGVSTCATCDGAFFKDKDILVVGGGDSALEEALFLTHFGSRVTVVHRRDQLRASKIMQERAKKHPKIHFVWNATVTDILGDRKVEGVVIRDTITGERSERSADAVFVAIGHVPNTDVFSGQVELDKKGYIVAPDGVRTNVEGVFVAGDVQDTQYRQAVTAAGLGCRAATEAERYLEAREAQPVAGH